MELNTILFEIACALKYQTYKNKDWKNSFLEIPKRRGRH